MRTGRRPKWCPDTCRHRAWEQRRAVASGRAAVEVERRGGRLAHERLKLPGPAWAKPWLTWRVRWTGAACTTATSGAFAQGLDQVFEPSSAARHGSAFSAEPTAGRRENGPASRDRTRH